MDVLDINIINNRENHSNDGVWVTFEIINKSDRDVYVLVTGTPLAGLRSDCLVVTRNGQKVRYDGPMVKRAAPRPQDFILLKPGERRSAEINISTAYAIHGGDKIKVKFKEETLLFTFNPPSPESIQGIKKTARQESLSGKLPTVKSNHAALEVVETGTRHLTLGEQARLLDKEEDALNKKKDGTDLLMEAELVVGKARPPKFAEGTAQEQKAIIKAHKQAYKMVSKVKLPLKATAGYKKWFGELTPPRAEKVADVFEKVKGRLESTTFTYHNDLMECSQQGDEYAFTYDRSRQIYICHLFWTAPPTGNSSQAGTVVHEHTHTSGHTDDIDDTYGEEACEDLARDHPLQATRNADNFEFYCEAMR